MKKELKKVPKKNSLILFIVVVATILLTFYIKEWIETYRNNEISMSPLSGVVSEFNSNELDLVLNESNQLILYVSYVNDMKIHQNEKQILNKITTEELDEYVLYYDATELLDEDKHLKFLKDKFELIKDDIKKAPLFIYLKNGEGIEVVNSTDDNLVGIKELAYLIEKYEIGN